MQAIVLAGGMGTRLKSVVADIPKPMAPVAGKPFLEYVLGCLAKSGIEKTVIASGYRAQVISDYFGGDFLDMRLEYSVESEPLGTGGAIKAALKKCSGDRAVVLNGDTFFAPDFAAMSALMTAENAETVVAVKEMRDFSRYGTVLSSGGRITAFCEKRECEVGYINAGAYLIKTDALDEYEGNFSFERDYLEKQVGEKRIFCFEGRGYFVDIGVPEDYSAAQEAFKSGIPD